MSKGLAITQAIAGIAMTTLLASAAPLAGAQGTQAAQGTYAQRYAAVCASCHGADGRSDMAGTPVLAGQHSFYAITQLFLFREGRRDNPAMSAVAKTMKDEDLRGFSEFIATLAPVPAAPPAAAPDAARMARGQALAQTHRCVICHGADLSGGQQVPRIAQQREDYLQLTLHGFRTGKRPGYTQAMTEALSGIPPEDLDTLAYYVARFPGAAAKPPGK
ncbi:c-type cytochrome [Variovorax paradoxus]|uniref:c-type cytochrome n=1 Tax=Variovorax paradoxus TaxID=34073 RepID=UPI00278AAFC1|nr:c-type cytochrome [Variovorax paradoxus]MDQ0589752.1 cytochrome c553 [Variovorax paradoxus]